MQLKRLLPVAIGILLPLAFLVNKFGISWGLSAENKETTEGLLTGLGLGCLVWFGFVLWKGRQSDQA